MKKTHIPFANTQSNFAQVADEVIPIVNEILTSGSYIQGDHVNAFENEFASYCGVPYAVGMANGTDALRLAMQSVGVGPGSEVVTVSHTFVATVEAAVELGAVVKFVDVDPQSGLIDIGLLREAVTTKTVAIVPVHLYGRPVPMEDVMEIAGEYGCAVIEDAAQAHGAMWDDKRIGSWGDIACFSFYPTKNLGACGDAGAAVTASGELAERMRMLAEHGGAEKYVHEMVGWNSRLDAIQAAVLSVKLPHLDVWNARRRSLAALYGEMLADIEDIVLPKQITGGEQVFHLYAARVKNRDAFREALAEKGIGTGIHYPIPVHLQAGYQHLHQGGGSLAHSENWAATEVSLPLFPEMTDSDVFQVCDAIREIVAKGKVLSNDTTS